MPNSVASSAPGGDGNAGTGYDSLSLTKNAKNALIVGAVNDVTSDPYTSAQIVTASFSSYGPTDDGRVKPDVVGNGVSLLSSVATSDTAYAYASGTSMSSPNVAGTAVLLIEHFANEFGAEPLSASTKGLLIHTASDAGNPGPDYAYGWGLVNAAAAATFISDAATADTKSYFEERSYGGSAWTLDLASDGTQPLKATIVWTDPAPAALPGSGLDDRDARAGRRPRSVDHGAGRHVLSVDVGSAQSLHRRGADQGEPCGQRRAGADRRAGGGSLHAARRCALARCLPSPIRCWQAGRRWKRQRPR